MQVKSEHRFIRLYFPVFRGDEAGGKGTFADNFFRKIILVGEFQFSSPCEPDYFRHAEFISGVIYFYLRFIVQGIVIFSFGDHSLFPAVGKRSPGDQDQVFDLAFAQSFIGIAVSAGDSGCATGDEKQCEQGGKQEKMFHNSP